MSRRGPLPGSARRSNSSEALGVGPVEVVEHHHARRPAADRGEQGEAGPHALVDVALGVDHHLEALVGLVAGVTEGVEQQLEGPAQRARVGLPRQHHGSRRQAPDELPDQTGLAHARLAADQGDGRGGPVLGQPHEAVDLGRPPDHHGREPRPPDEHLRSVGLRPGRRDPSCQWARRCVVRVRRARAPRRRVARRRGRVPGSGGVGRPGAPATTPGGRQPGPGGGRMCSACPQDGRLR